MSHICFFNDKAHCLDNLASHVNIRKFANGDGKQEFANELVKPKIRIETRPFSLVF